MTIKAVEQLTGMTRANIRFYESEGLLSPKRNPNGHREYSESDVEIIKKIKLLRMLHISLEDIKAVKNQEKNLLEILDKQYINLEEQKTSLTKAQNVCKTMYMDGVDFTTLKSDFYLKQMEKEVAESKENENIVSNGFPIRRFLARGLDYGLYAAIWHMILMIGLKIKVADMNFGEQLLDSAVVLFLMIVIESVLLSCFGTTVGKYIFGIRVTNLEEQRLTFWEALNRTLYVVWFGRGFDIPVYTIWCQWTCYKKTKDGLLLPWEEDTDIHVDEKILCRFGLYVATFVFAVGGTFWASGVAALPKHQGEISVAEFVENYNELVKYYDLFNGAVLTEDGYWTTYDNSEVIIFLGNGSDEYTYPTFTFTEEDGEMKGMSFTGNIISLYEAETVISMKAFINARTPESVYSNDFYNIWDACSWSEPNTEMEIDKYGVRIKYKDLSDKENKFIFSMEVIE